MADHTMVVADGDDDEMGAREGGHIHLKDILHCNHHRHPAAWC